MKFVIKYDILLPPIPNTIILLPCQRQESFLLGDYFDFYCYIAEKYIHITAIWFFSLPFLAILGQFFWETGSWGFAWRKFIGEWSQEQLILVIFFFTFSYLIHLEFVLAMGWAMGAISPFSNVYLVFPTPICKRSLFAPMVRWQLLWNSEFPHLPGSASGLSVLFPGLFSLFVCQYHT